MEHVIEKTAASKVDYTVDWSPDMAADEIISTSTWAADDGITVETDSKTNQSTTVWVSGGTAGVKYKVTNTIVTNNNPARTLQKTLVIPVKG